MTWTAGADVDRHATRAADQVGRTHSPSTAAFAPAGRGPQTELGTGRVRPKGTTRALSLRPYAEAGNNPVSLPSGGPETEAQKHRTREWDARQNHLRLTNEPSEEAEACRACLGAGSIVRPGRGVSHNRPE